MTSPCRDRLSSVLVTGIVVSLVWSACSCMVEARGVPGDLPLLPESIRGLEYSSGAECLTENRTGQMHAMYGAQLTLTPVGCTTTTALLGSLRGEVALNHTLACNEPARDADMAALLRYKVPNSTFAAWAPDFGSVNSRSATCAAVCQGSAGVGTVTMALWGTSCYCFNSSLATSPPHAAPAACCDIVGGGIHELEAAANRGVDTSNLNMFVVAVGNSCLDVAASTCREASPCGRRVMANISDGVPGATCCAEFFSSEEDIPAYGIYISCAVGAVCVAGVIYLRCYRRRNVPDPRAVAQREAQALGSIVPLEEIPLGSTNGSHLRNEDEAASLSAAFMFGMRRTTIANDPATSTALVEAGERDDCVVCLNPFMVGASVSVLPCGHMLHTPCLMDFVTFHLRRYSDLLCPTCRCPLLGEPKPTSNTAAARNQAAPVDEARTPGPAAAATTAAVEMRPVRERAPSAAAGGDGAASATYMPPRRSSLGAAVSVGHGSDDDDDDIDASPVRPLNPFSRAANGTGAAPPVTPPRPHEPAAAGATPLLVMPRYDGPAPSPPR